MVAGEVIARVSGSTWEEFIKERIFDPLKMDNSYASLTFIKDKDNVALPHLNINKNLSLTDPEQWDPKKINGAAGGIYSNVNDIASWMLVNLNKGRYGDNLEKQLFSEVSQQEIWKIHTTTKVNRNPRYNSHFAGYGLGWGLTDVNGYMVVSHTGGLIGMLSKTLLVPDLNLGIIVLTNIIYIILLLFFLRCIYNRYYSCYFFFTTLIIFKWSNCSLFMGFLCIFFSFYSI